jgi:signal transduction histidine kinase
VLVDAADDELASSRPRGAFAALLHADSVNKPVISLGDRRWVRNQGYFHTLVPLSGRRGAESGARLHILYPEDDYRNAWQWSLYPSLGLVALALPVVMLLAAVTAGRIAGRTSRLQGQVDRIARGDFQQLALPERDDEIGALGEAVNRMAAMLARYEDEIRRTEQMRTLAQLGGGIAHQLRNSATGCGLALDMHSQECSSGESCESLNVAKRQLQLMEEYLQRFLQLGKPAAAEPNDVIDLAAVVDDLLPLVEPAARHAGVELRWFPSSRDTTLRGNLDRLRQLVINLLMNAIEAAAQGRAQDNRPADVVVELSGQPPNWLVLSVTDTGPGPAESVREQLFEPFVSEKRDGVGLGLSVAREVAQEHGGQIEWQRAGNKTRFVVTFPSLAPQAATSSEQLATSV